MPPVITRGSQGHKGDNEDPQSLHKYLYTHSDPVNGTDPSGHLLVEAMMKFAIQNYIKIVSAVPAVAASIKAAGTVNLVSITNCYNQVAMSAAAGMHQIGGLITAAQRLYPRLKGMDNHHVIPSYIFKKLLEAGVVIPPHLQNILVRMNNAYHQVIHNAIRLQFPEKGNTWAHHKPKLDVVLKVLAEIYEKNPTP